MHVALFRTPGLLGAAIRWQSRGQYNHAGLVLPNGELIEAQPGGVRCVGPIYPASRSPVPGYKDGQKVDLYKILGVTPEMVKGIEAFARAQVGKPYDWTMVLRFVSRQQEARRSTGKWFCSELVYAACHHVDWDLFHNTEPWEVHPDLLKRSTRLRYEQTITL